MKIAVYQYDSLRGGVVSIHELLQYLKEGRQRVFQSAGSFIKNPFIVFSLLGRRRSNRAVGKEVAVLDYVDVEQTVDEDGNKEVEVTEDDAVVEEEEEQQPIDEEDGLDPEQGEEEEDPEGGDGEREEEKPQRLILLDLVVV
jgi:hypothetical protein